MHYFLNDAIELTLDAYDSPHMLICFIILQTAITPINNGRFAVISLGGNCYWDHRFDTIWFSDSGDSINVYFLSHNQPHRRLHRRKFSDIAILNLAVLNWRI